VWIHGGAYAIGTSGLPEYDGARLARDGVVLVTFNYRVGVEGFAHIEGAPANRGLLDAVAALRWVRDNIERFGGDPANVTVFGESAGGGVIAALLAMPAAAGLFRRAIAQSVPGTFFTPELAAAVTESVAAVAGLPPTHEALTRAEPMRLVAAQTSVAEQMREYTEWGALRVTETPFSPVVDGEVLPRTPWRALVAGAARDVELLTGHNKDEYRLFLAASGLLGKITEFDANTVLDYFAPAPEGPAGYRKAYPDLDAGGLYELAFSDWLFRMPTLHLAEAQAAGGGRVHVYELAWTAPGMGGIFGACHGLDVPLVFGNLDRGQPALLIGETPSPEAEALSAEMRAGWTSFAADGDPGWPAYDIDQRLVQRFDLPSAVIAYPEEHSRLIWQRHTFPALPLVRP
jgi:para-nitrobenzyl esterase